MSLTWLSVGTVTTAEAAVTPHMLVCKEWDKFD